MQQLRLINPDIAEECTAMATGASQGKLHQKEECSQRNKQMALK